jgi:transcriptional regulator with XRE-family HTH domain
MKLYQSELLKLKGQGMTQRAIARAAGVTETTVKNALEDRHEPHDKLLNYLGIRRVVVFELVNPIAINSEKDVGPVTRRKIRKANRVGAPKSKATKPLQSAPPATISDAPALLAARAPLESNDVETSPPVLTVERIATALRYGLKAGAAWSDFLTINPMLRTDTDAAWLSYCAEVGNMQPADTSEGIPGALGKPGELYSHLAPVERGPDMRRPGVTQTPDGSIYSVRIVQPGEE